MGNVPNLRFPEFTGEWKKCKLKDVCTFYSGGTPSSSNKDYYNGDIPFIRSGELHSDKTELFISSKGLKNSSAKMVSKGDLLLALYGATSGDIAISQIEGAINQAILCIKTDQSKGFIEATWCKHVKRILQTYLQGGQGNLSADIVKNIAFYFAPLKEQEKLTQLMKLLDDRIATQNKIIDKLQSLIGGIESGEMKNISKDGKWVKLGDICNITTGKLDANAMVDGGRYPFFTCAETPYSINEYAFDTEALLISGNGANLGYINYYKGRFNAYQRTYVLDAFTEDIHFIKFALKVFLPKRIAIEKSTSNTPYIVMSTLSEMKLFMPSRQIQKRLSTMMNLLENSLTNHRELLFNYSRMKEYLLQNMFI